MHDSMSGFVTMVVKMIAWNFRLLIAEPLTSTMQINRGPASMLSLWGYGVGFAAHCSQCEGTWGLWVILCIAVQMGRSPVPAWLVPP